MTENKTFNGFPKKGIRFLLDLAENNNKAWFEENKHIYSADVQQPALALVAALGERLQEIAPGIEYDLRANGAGSLMRIYRDTRFSPDKTPYKTNVAMIWWQGNRKKMENPSFGFQAGTAGAGLYAGQFTFPKEMLTPYRNAVADDKMGQELTKVIDAVQSAGDYEISGEYYKKVPRGFDDNHPRAHLLRYNGLHASAQVDPEALFRPELVDILFEHCRNMAPIQQWLVRLDRQSG
ncbi:MAG: DUF2461 domain-containing protein [Caldilineaceae bacterium]|nr:DUF2461 domain-containing protein [Caldilineaceae bacterium]